MLLAKGLVAGLRGGGLARGRRLWVSVAIMLVLAAVCGCSAASAPAAGPHVTGPGGRWAGEQAGGAGVPWSG